MHKLNILDKILLVPLTMVQHSFVSVLCLFKTILILNHPEQKTETMLVGID